MLPKAPRQREIANPNAKPASKKTAKVKSDEYHTLKIKKAKHTPGINSNF